ncbi:ankyrin [Eremomyces bilateralis CBS 781.70]|uniref:Ankyrin n=1 Tax=Eremomyces bilateralis CBS 781.70 TaxID=1392243 RepID=A0A6G1GD83_9PEZI|nr:ankyrin [Eremomyces bilateralis CBS 781.70]KAF1816057.1 ankyrin [Eremomyces bilateralis CBS 781.70]
MATTTPASSLPLEALNLATKPFDFARAGDTSVLKSYIAAGIPPNFTNQAGDTFLMLASYHGHADTTKMLLDAGAGPNSLNDRGQSSLAGSVFKGHVDAVKVLVEGGADMEGGRPNAWECAEMFKRGDLLEVMRNAQYVSSL